MNQRLKKIRLCLFDVDGILTDGRIFWTHPQGWTRFYHVRDGFGIRLLLKHGFEVGILSAGKSKDVMRRMKVLGVSHVYLGSEDKLVAMKALLKKTGFKADQVSYMGDELFDLPVLNAVGFSASVPSAPQAVRDSVHYVTQAHGGWGAAREVIDRILVAQGINPMGAPSKTRVSKPS